jgi:hypothetical protein
MLYTNNQYIRLDIPLEEIAKIEIKTDKKNKMISELEIKEDDSNIIIANGINKKIDYSNIYSSVRILITDERTLIGKIEEIPDFIEVVIVNNKIYYDRNETDSDKEFDLLLFEDNKDIFEMKVERLTERGKINSYNKVGNTILNYLIWNKKEEKALELIERMEIESINKVNKYEDTALIYACCNKMERVALKLLEREDINVNQVNEGGVTALIWACKNKTETIALKLLEREDINVNQVNKYGETALDYAIENNIESVINRINELNNK